MKLAGRPFSEPTSSIAGRLVGRRAVPSDTHEPSGTVQPFESGEPSGPGTRNPLVTNMVGELGSPAWVTPPLKE